MIKQSPVVSIIISVFGQLEYTKRCLDQLEKTLLGKISYEVLIVDDASTDCTKQFLLTLPFPYRVFFNETNKGYAKNNNFAAREAKGEFICFLNNDVFVEGNWLLPMIEVFQTKKMVGMVGNVQKLANSIKYDHMGIVFSPEGKPVHYGQGFFHLPFKDKLKQWNAVTAACCVTRRSLFYEMDGFDEEYLNGCEDIDLCLRMGLKKLKHYVVNYSIVYHVKCASEGRLTHNMTNELRFQRRWEKEIAGRYALLDRFNYAYWYIIKSILRPFGSKFHFFYVSISILNGTYRFRK
ncbi:glycosyltransferase family 2 protein [Opitutales bacterium]|nr:glycosyltransferase family 2 protein [Opitutales bacterium]